MVHVSSGARHKMLAFASTESPLPTIDTIITVSTKDGSLNISSSPNPSSSHTSEPAIISTELNRELHIIAEEPSGGVSTRIHNNHHNFNTIHNGTTNMNQNQEITEGDNGNANYLADTLNLNRNMNTSMKNDGLQLISHGLTDSVCESLKMLDNENDNMRIVEQNKVFTEEIVITTTKKTGIMKSTGHVPATHGHTGSLKNKTINNEWQRHPMDDGSFSQNNDSEFTSHTVTTKDFNTEAEVLSGSDKGPSNCSLSNSSSIGTGLGTPTNSCPSANKLSKLANGAKHGLKRVSFGKGSMVETLVYESPVSEESIKISKTGVAISNGNSKVQHSIDETDASFDSAEGSTGGSRPPSRVRVTFFESEKPLAVSSPESDIIDFDLSNMTLPGSPNAVDHTPTYNRQMSEVGWDNPFRPDGDLSKEADQIVELIKEGKPINEETLRSKSPSVNDSFNVSHQNQLNASPKGVNGTKNGGGGPDVVTHVAPAAQASQVEHVVLKKKKGCCVIQ